MIYHLKGISKKYSRVPIKTGLLIPYLVRGYIEKWQSQKIFSKAYFFALLVIYHLREKVFPGTFQNIPLNLLASGRVPQEHPIPSPEKEVMHQQPTE